MRTLNSFVAGAALLSSLAFLPSRASAITPGGLTSPNASMIENVARVCREVCRGRHCKTTCHWEPNHRRHDNQGPSLQLRLR